MKKLYSIFIGLISFASFGQLLSDDFNYADGALLTANGWTAHSGAGSQAIDVGTSNGLTYSGYSGLTGFTAAAVGNAVRLDNTGEDVNKAFATPSTSGDLYVSFLINVTTAVDGYFLSLGTGTTTFFARLYAKPSTTAGKINFGIGNSAAVYSTTDFDPNTTYLAVIKYNVSTTGSTSLWIIPSGIPATEAAAGTPTATASGSGTATVAGVYLRQYNAGQNITIDGLRVYTTWFNTTSCALNLGTETTACNTVTSAIDTYSITVPFTGGNTGSYTLSTTSGTISGDNPSTIASGNIVISGINEGTNVTLTINGACTISKNISAPECKPINTIPFNEPFPYTVGNSLNGEQKWSIVNTGDNILVTAGNLNYTGINSTGNSVSFSGTGAESRTLFTSTTSGSIYASMLFNSSDYSNVTTDLTSAYFALFTDNTGATTNARIWIRKNGTQYQFGLGTGATATDWDANLYNVGTTQYLVLGYDFTANSLRLFVNPTIGGTASPTVAVTPTSAFANLGGFMLRQDTATNTPTIIIDEITIDTTPNFTLSSASFSQINGLKMYPNPVKEGNLHIETALNGDINVAIFDLVGKEVVNTKVVNNTINVANLTSGIYVVKITEEDKTSTQKLVID